MLAPRCDSAVSVILLQRSGWGRRQMGGPRWRGWRLLWASYNSASSLSGSCTVLTCPPRLLKAHPSSRASSQGLGEKWGACTKGALRGLGLREAISVPAAQSALWGCAPLLGVVLASAPSFPPFSLSPVQSSQYIDHSAQRRQRTFLSVHNVYVSTSALCTFFGRCF